MSILKNLTLAVAVGGIAASLYAKARKDPRASKTLDRSTRGAAASIRSGTSPSTTGAATARPADAAESADAAQRVRTGDSTAAAAGAPPATDPVEPGLPDFFRGA